MNKSIEEFLDLSEEEIKKRKEELIRKIPTIPGIEYLRTRAKVFEVQPWPFISYLAYYNQELLYNALNQYFCYDAGENVQAIMEQLREDYIIWKVIEDMGNKSTINNGK